MIFIAAVQSQKVPFNTLKPRQNVRDFVDDIFKYIFLNESLWISLKFVPKVRINNIPALIASAMKLYLLYISSKIY